MSDAVLRAVLPFGLGLGAALGQAPVSLPWITLLALGAVFWLCLDSKRPTFWLGWVFGAGYFAASLFWIVEPFLVDLPRHGWMAPFALVLTAGGFALFWGVAFVAARRLARGRSELGQAIAWAAAFATVEMARSYILSGFPWALIGHVWIGWAPMQWAAFVGPLGLTLITLLLPALFVVGWRAKAWPGVVALCGGFALAFGGGFWHAARPVPDAAGAPVVRMVQPNAAQHLKWHPDHALEFFERMVAFSAAEAEGGGPRPDLIVWPENAIVQVLDRADAWLEQVRRGARGVPVVFGIQRRDDADTYYNTLAVMDEAGGITALYDKHHLVPFGEYLPLSGWFDAVGQTLLGQDMGFGYTAGPGPVTLPLPGRLGTVLPLICYEGIFPHNVAAAPERPDFLLLITNDAWFGEIAGPYQHLAQARLRAVEQGLPMVRVANTGVSAVIDARGRVMTSIALGEAGWRDALLPRALPPTLYARTGDWPWAVLLALVLGGFVATGRRARPIDAPAQRQ